MSSIMFVKLLTVFAAFISPLFAQMDDQFITDDIMPRCYKYPAYVNDRLYINGQENPLSNSLENFLNLIEKFELANPDINLKDELLILLENYTAENVEYIFSKGFSQLNIANTPLNMKKIDIDRILDTGANRDNIRYPHNDPFDDNEKCSLYFMLTRSINSTAMTNIDSGETTSPVPVPDDRQKNRYFPREQGVVSISNSSTQSIALGRVLRGLFLGLNGGAIRKLNDVKDSLGIAPQELGSLGTENVLPLFLLTVADQLALADAENDDPTKTLQKDGKWKSVQKPNVATNSDDLDIICPLVYVLPQDVGSRYSRYTYSSLRGGIDGLILGSIISPIDKASSSVRLSQILRMYYSPSGITENTQAPELNGKVTFCKRSDGIANLVEILKMQIKVYYSIYAKAFKVENLENIANSLWRIYDENKSGIFALDGELSEFCDQEIDKAKYDTYPIESSSDIVVVMDTTENKNTFEAQQLIIGHLSRKLDIRFNGSSLTVFLDRKNETSGNDLTNILPQAFSSACSACYINQYELPSGLSGETEKEFKIDSITKTLNKMKREEENLGGAKGKIVIYFDFDAVEKSQSKPTRALRDFYRYHRDVEVFAVGNNKEVMKLYTQNNEHNTVPLPNNSPSDVAETLASKIKEVPSRLQYNECNKTKSGSSVLYEGLITPGTRQRWSMSADYFYKSFVAKVIFEANKGDITVCHNRARPNTEITKDKNCKQTSPSDRSLEFVNTNPCKGFERETCSQMFFTVIGTLPSDDAVTQSNSVSQNGFCKDTKDARCKTLNEIPFTVKQDGIWCSGCGKIMSSPLMLLAVCFIAYLLKFVS